LDYRLSEALYFTFKGVEAQDMDGLIHARVWAGLEKVIVCFINGDDEVISFTEWSHTVILSRSSTRLCMLYRSIRLLAISESHQCIMFMASLRNY
jgi:hypothetical protein